MIAEELLKGEDDAAVATALQSLGEDPARHAGVQVDDRHGRPTDCREPARFPGFAVGNRVVVDYHARIEVRHVGSKQVIGTVETVAAGFPNESEVRSRGQKGAAMEALASAVEKAVAQFAPAVVPHRIPSRLWRSPWP